MLSLCFAVTFIKMSINCGVSFLYSASCSYSHHIADAHRDNPIFIKIGALPNFVTL